MLYGKKKREFAVEDTVVKYLDSNKFWVTQEVVSSNQGRIRLEMSRDATTRLRGR